MSDSELSDIDDSYYDEDEVMQASSEDGMQEDGDAYMSDNEGGSDSCCPILPTGRADDAGSRMEPKCAVSRRHSD